MKKIVLKLEVHDDKGKQKAMKTVSTLSGIETLSIDLKEKKLTVIGDVDPVQVVEKLKKISLHPELLLVGPAKEPEKKKTDENVIKKDEGGKKDHNEKVDELVKLYKNYNPNMTQHYKASRSVEEFERLNKIGEGTYGVVYKARDKNTGEIVALKKLKISKEEEEEGFPLTFLREINILLTCHHPSIVHVKEVVVGTKLDEVFLVMEYLENDLKVLIEKMKRRLSQREVKCLMLQLLEGVRYLHDNWVIHRDLKTSNLLINNKGELKIGDFGLARRTQSRNPLKPNYTHNVVTLWYRSPELLLGVKRYSNAIDMWSVGCIMAELLTNKLIFDGNSEINQIYKIFGILGTPDEKIWPGFTKLPGINKVKFVNKKHNYSLRRKFPSISFTDTVLSNSGIDLLNKLLTYDPNKRITAEAALSHAWFRE